MTVLLESPALLEYLNLTTQYNANPAITLQKIRNNCAVFCLCTFHIVKPLLTVAIMCIYNVSLTITILIYCAT